jgi:signal transduction histidine kinase
MSQELSRENILEIIFPALLISAAVSIILSLGIGLYSSRKYAVPIYKIEQWLSLLLQGKISTTLQFREKEEMKDLSDKCNNLGVKLTSTFQELQTKINALKEENIAPELVNKLEDIVSKYEIEIDPIKVSTTYCKISGNQTN